MTDYTDYLKNENKEPEETGKVHIVLLLVVLVIITITMGVYSGQLREKTMNDMKLFLQSGGESSAMLFDSIVLGSENAVNILAMIESVEWDEKKISQERVKELKNMSSFSVVGFCDRNGAVYTSDDESFIVTDARYFEDGMKGNTGHLLILESAYTNENYLLSYAPIVSNGEVQGVLIGGYDSESMSNFLVTNYYGMDVKAIISNANGDVIACRGCRQKKDTLEELFTSETYPQLDKVKFRAPTKADEECFELSTKTGFDYIKHTICPYSGWIVTMVIPDDITGHILTENYRTVAVLQFICMGSVAFYMIIIILYERKKSKNLEKRNAISDDIITAVISVFTKVIEIDFANDTYRFITGTVSMNGRMPLAGKYSDLVGYLSSYAYDTKAKRAVMIATSPATVRKTMEEKKSYTAFEYHMKGKSTKWEKIFIIPLKRGFDKMERALLCAEDISFIKNQDEIGRAALLEAYTNAEKANSAKSSFLANMSHDIRTPMNAIVGMTKIAETHIDDQDRVKDCLRKIAISSGQLLDLINDVLDMSKIEAGKSFIQDEVFEIKELVEGISVITETLSSDKEIRQEIIASELQHPKVIGDKGRIRQIMNNLISNAFKYTPSGGHIRITLAEKDIDRPGFTMLEFTVVDNGIGMSKKFQESLFKPFSRATDDERLEGIQGTGLGMAITKNLVEMMNGNIKVNSKLNKGTSFTVTMILKTADEAVVKKESEKESEKAVAREFSGKRCLLVEDNEINREIATELIGMTKLEVECVKDGREAVEKMENVPAKYYDIIFMDIQMPVMNGYEAAEAIRKLPGAYPKKVPIIALTANAFAEDVQAARNAGMNEHLAKPLELERLIKILNDFL
ncbi:MAG: response regulator [Lachnospiraceae bacterium]|nr:response regulator [Lachnospiraceae bacterium]